MTKNSIDVSVCSSTSTTATGSAYCSGYIFAQNVWILRVSEWWRTNAIYSEERAIYNESHWQLVLLLDTFVWLWLAYYNKFVVSLSPFVYLTFRSSLAFFSCKLFFSRLFSFVLLLLTHLIHVTFRHPQPFKVCTMFIQYIKHGIYVIRGLAISTSLYFTVEHKEKKKLFINSLLLPCVACYCLQFYQQNLTLPHKHFDKICNQSLRPGLCMLRVYNFIVIHSHISCIYV